MVNRWHVFTVWTALIYSILEAWNKFWNFIKGTSCTCTCPIDGYPLTCVYCQKGADLHYHGGSEPVQVFMSLCNCLLSVPAHSRIMETAGMRRICKFLWSLKLSCHVPSAGAFPYLHMSVWLSTADICLPLKRRWSLLFWSLGTKSYVHTRCLLYLHILSWW